MTRRYLRAKELLPGDVLLSRGAGPESDAIARYTFGPYSHAAVYIHFGVIFEAIADGVGFTGLEIVRWCDAGRGYLLDVSNYACLEVRRHPILAAECATVEGQRSVSERLGRFLVPENGKQYPPLTALAYAVPWAPAVVVRPFLGVAAQRMGEQKVIAAGMFCSQLVCEALKKLNGEPLQHGFFGRTLPSRNVSPNHLRSPQSLLQVVPDVVVDSTFPCDEPELDPVREHQRQAEETRMLQEARLRQREGLLPLDKHSQMKLRIAVDTLSGHFESLR